MLAVKIEIDVVPFIKLRMIDRFSCAVAMSGDKRAGVLRAYARVRTSRISIRAYHATIIADPVIFIRKSRH